jgi:uncharacterized protein (DUF1810 family)
VISDSDPFYLQRFVDAQAGSYDTALAELRSGEKRSHWMWFVFPQFAGLGLSPTSRHFAIRSIEEARAYLDDPLLGVRLRKCIEALLPWAGKRDAVAIFGPVDSMKLRSSLTLFALAAPDEPLFGRALSAFFGSPDPQTLRLAGAR